MKLLQLQLYLKLIAFASIFMRMKSCKSDVTQSTATWALFLTVHSVLIGKMESTLKMEKLPPLEWYDVLWALERAPDHRLRMHELAHLVVLSRSNLTRLVDRLERAKLVERKPSLDDKRGAYCVLKPAGAALRKKMWPVYEKCIFQLFNVHISPKEAGTLNTVLRRILAAVRSKGSDLFLE